MRWQQLQNLGNIDKTSWFLAMSWHSCTEQVSSQMGRLGAYHSPALLQKTHGADLLLQACTKADCQKADM